MAPLSRSLTRKAVPLDNGVWLSHLDQIETEPLIERPDSSVVLPQVHNDLPYMTSKATDVVGP